MGEALFDKVAGFYDYEQKEFRKDIPFYRECAKKCGGEVLELACGTGRVLIPLASEGIKMTGLDESEEMLNVAHKKINANTSAKQNITLVRGDMRDFDLNKKFSMIFIAFRSFQSLLTKKDQSTCLQSAHKHLLHNGVFIVDLFAPRHDYLAAGRMDISLGEFYDEEKNVRIKRRAQVNYNLAEQKLHDDTFYEWTDDQGNSHQEIWSFDLAYLFRYEAELLLEKCGFVVENVYGDFDKSPYNYYSGEQIFVARKR